MIPYKQGSMDLAKAIVSRISVVIFLLFMSCTDLDETIYSQLDNEKFLQTEEEILSALGAAYSGLRTFQKNDHLWTVYCTTDEVAIPGRTGGDWAGDGQDQQMTDHTWSTNNRFFRGSWEAFFAQINTCNRIIYQLEGLDKDRYAKYISEVKTIRALWYLWLIDMWGNVPIVDRFDVPEGYLPATSSRTEVYDFIEKEITENIANLSTEKSVTTYARVDQWTAKAILAKLYLNAEVYTGTAQWQKALDACNDIIGSGQFTFSTTYGENFSSENQNSTEAIFAITFDDIYTEWGWILPLVSLHYSSQQTFNLTNGPWNGLSVQTEFFYRYGDEDIRREHNFLWGPQFASTGEPLVDGGYEPELDPDGPEINFTPEFVSLYNTIRQSGVRIKKWEIEMGGNGFLNSDFFVFRYSDILLMKAEILWRMNPADTEALQLVNQIRERAGVEPWDTLSEQGLLDERGRELFMEGWRRSDMIRFDRYNDPTIFKPYESEAFRRLYPIPKDQLDANPNLEPNPGYY
ncbi:RagB/SusD family nutrient uptake outer membrane protein [Flagellimonas sp.]|uniref:RagB/SusD family nutrient uptake outer membrane protein n=1 Tax=Flagellimonas sp. TaxID=2058762 RepID=UPI003AB16431